MATNTSLLARIKKIEEMLEPEILNFPREKTKVNKVETGWQVAKLNFEDEKEAIDFSKRLKKQGLMAYLDEILNQLEDIGNGD